MSSYDSSNILISNASSFLNVVEKTLSQVNISKTDEEIIEIASSVLGSSIEDFNESLIKTPLIFIHDDSSVSIGNVHIKNEIFEEELSSYVFNTREDEIDSLLNIMSCLANSYDVNGYQIAKEALKQLFISDDYIVLSSINSIEVIIPSIEPKRFNEICQEIINL